MKDAMISVNDLYKGMKLKKDILNDMYEIVFTKGTILSDEDIVVLTSFCQSYLNYKDPENDPETVPFSVLASLNDYIRTVTFAESYGINLEETAAFFDPPENHSAMIKSLVQGYTEHVLYKYFHRNIPVSSDMNASIPPADVRKVAEYISCLLYESWDKRIIMPLDFYRHCTSWTSEHFPALYHLIKKLIKPMPEGSAVILNDGEEYQVVYVTAEEPFRPVLRKKHGTSTYYFSEDVEDYIEMVRPIILPS